MEKLSINPTIKIVIPVQQKPGFTPRNQIEVLPSKIKAPSSSLSSKSFVSTSSSNNGRIPTMEDILESSRAQNLDMKLQTVGPFFRITATSSDTRKELGKAEGLIRVWFEGKLLHLDSIKLRRETLSMKRSIFGVGLFLGAVAIRHGFDSGCSTAQLLAINDTELYHSKLCIQLVKFYSRVGFKAVDEVDGSSLGDLSHMLVWGGRGTRMDANIEDLLVKWCSRFKPTH